MSNIEIISSKQIFDDYRKKISLVHQGKQLASASIVTAIVEIGKLCIEAREYKDRLNIKNKEKLWKEFSENLPVSKSSISKYISVAEHPYIRLKKNHKFLPPSVYSLYELSKIQSKKLETLVNKNKINPDIGRSNLNLLLGSNSKPIQIKQVSNDIELMTLKIKEKNWENKFELFQDELINFLNEKEISFEFGTELKRRERTEDVYYRNIQKQITLGMKKYFKERLIVFVDSSLNGKNLGNVRSLSKKLKLLKIGEDEVDYKNNLDQDELKDQFISVGLGTEDEWNEHLSSVIGESHEKYPPPLHLLKQKDQIFDDDIFQPFKKSNKKRNFDGFKV